MLPNPQLSRVVLLGTGDHHSDQLPAIPAVRRNLIDLDAVLSSPPDGIVGPDQCVVVLNPDSPRSFMGQLRKNANQAEDLLLVYYAGHGVRHDRKDKLYLATRETDPEELDGTAVPFEAVADVIEGSFAQTRLLILDCCYSGLALGKMSAVVPDLQSIRIAGTTVITSCPPNEISLAPVGERNTAFTGELLELLRNGSPVPGAPLDVQRLFGSLRAAMIRRGLPSPKMQSGDTSAGLWLRQPQQPVPTRAAVFDAPKLLPTKSPVEAEAVQPLPVNAAPSGQRPQVALKHVAQRRPGSSLVTPTEPMERPGQPGRLRAVAAIARSAAQWVGTCFFLSYGLGCLVGAVFGPSPGYDLLGSAMLLPVGAAFAFFLVRRLVQQRGLRTRNAIRIAFPQSARRIEYVQFRAMLFGFVGSLLFTVSGIAMPTSDGVRSTKPSVSDLAADACLIICFGALTVIFGYGLYVRLRQRRS